MGKLPPLHWRSAVLQSAVLLMIIALLFIPDSWRNSPAICILLFQVERFAQAEDNGGPRSGVAMAVSSVKKLFSLFPQHINVVGERESLRSPVAVAFTMPKLKLQ
jgi:hypothetical protein